MNKLITFFLKGKNIDGLQCEERYIPSCDGECQIRVRVFRPKNCTENLPVMLYIHGGGYISGIPEMSLDIIERFIETKPCVVVAPDYRKALTKPFPAGFNDCYDVLLWANTNADKLGAYNDRFIIAGHSAGGGLTAAVTLKARDTQDVHIAFQLPIYPMIDDRQTTDSACNNNAPVWNTNTNNMAWGLYLKSYKESGTEISPYAAAARNKDYTDFPPTITFVGSIEPFCDETISYVDALKKQGVEVAFKLYEGCFHGFDMLASKSNVAKDAVNFTYLKYAEFYDKYI